MKIYHNPRCSKSRDSYNLLESKGLDFETVEYLKTPLSKEDLKEVLKKLNMKAEDIIRKGEPDFKENFKGKKLTEAQWISAMVKYPKLIERPIVVKEDKAVIGRPLENVENLLSE